MSKIKKTWNEISADYQKNYRISSSDIHYGVSIPGESRLKLLGDVKNKRVLEVCCGGGQCSVVFARRGARATGIDISENQIRHAKNLAKKMKVRADFIVGDVENLYMLKPNYFDIVFSSYGLLYVKNLGKVFREVNKVLKSGGIFVFSFDHPMYETIDPKRLRIVKSYFKEGRVDFNWKVGNKKIRLHCFDRKIETIFDGLVETGFSVERIVEPAPYRYEKEWRDHYPLKAIRMVPSAIIFKCRKK